MHLLPFGARGDCTLFYLEQEKERVLHPLLFGAGGASRCALFPFSGAGFARVAVRWLFELGMQPAPSSELVRCTDVVPWWFLEHILPSL